jgi:CHAT domain-containing protein
MGDFTFLPLHAAGIYSGNALECASDFFVSSYTPSLSALIRAREGYKSVSRNQLKALLVAESDAPGLEPLDRVRDEVYALDQIIHYYSGIVLNDLDSVPTVEEILLNLPDAHILHLSCHGQQVDIPLQSRFALRDGPLTISSLMETNLPNAVLAFLSACETARGDKQQPDQAVHLAASMLFCGFRSVIATMW